MRTTICHHAMMGYKTPLRVVAGRFGIQSSWCYFSQQTSHIPTPSLVANSCHAERLMATVFSSIYYCDLLARMLWFILCALETMSQCFWSWWRTMFCEIRLTIYTSWQMYKKEIWVWTINFLFSFNWHLTYIFMMLETSNLAKWNFVKHI